LKVEGDPIMSAGAFQPREIGIELVQDYEAGEPFIDLELLRELAVELDRWPSIERIYLSPSGDGLKHPHYRRCLEILADSWLARSRPVIQYVRAARFRAAAAEDLLDLPVVTRINFVCDGESPALAEIETFLMRARLRRPDLVLDASTALPRPGTQPGSVQPRLQEVFTPLGIEVEQPEPRAAGEPTASTSRLPLVVVGGCPFIESDALWFTVHGLARPCCLADDERFNVGRYGPEQGFGELLNNETMQGLRHRLRLDQRAGLGPCKDCRLSLGGHLEQEELRVFWKKRDDAGLVQDLAERRHLFAELVPTEHRTVRVELGCGETKTPGFIGILCDKSRSKLPRPGVDVVADLDEPLPLPDDCADLVCASHSLEHVPDLPFTMSEVWRICKHGAQVCIVAPYSLQARELSNPYRKQVFTEHTPRFWTRSPLTLSDPAESAIHPGEPGLGLLPSDNRCRNVDLRCVRIEFGYLPGYAHLPPEEQRRARLSLDVCDQIVYHLIAIKALVTEEEFRAMAKRMEYFEPAHVQVRRLREKQEELNRKLETAREQARFHASSAEQLLGELRLVTGQHERLASACGRIENDARQLRLDLAEAGRREEQLRQQLGEAAQREGELRGQLGEVKKREGQLQQEQTELLNSKTWKAALVLRWLRHLAVPPRSIRARVVRRLLRMICG
jgi:SAM-dependent methyltransferase